MAQTSPDFENCGPRYHSVLPCLNSVGRAAGRFRISKCAAEIRVRVRRHTFGMGGGLGWTTASVGAGIVLPPLATSAGIDCPTGPAHGGGGIGLGVGTGGFGCAIGVPGAGGAGRLCAAMTRLASEGAWSTRGTPMGMRGHECLFPGWLKARHRTPPQFACQTEARSGS